MFYLILLSLLPPFPPLLFPPSAIWQLSKRVLLRLSREQRQQQQASLLQRWQALRKEVWPQEEKPLPLSLQLTHAGEWEETKILQWLGC